MSQHPVQRLAEPGRVLLRETFKTKRSGLWRGFV
jgi:hypothetical protein